MELASGTLVSELLTEHLMISLLSYRFPSVRCACVTCVDVTAGLKSGIAGVVNPSAGRTLGSQSLT